MAGGKEKGVKETGKRKKSAKLEKGSGSQPPTEIQAPSGSQNPDTSSIPNAEFGFVPLVHDPTLVPAEDLYKYVNHPSNRYLFRDEDAWRNYNGRALKKSVSKVFYYKLPEEMQIPAWEKDQINQMIDFWKWKPMIELNYGYNPHLVRLLYANMVENKNPWGLRTYYAGREIGVGPDNIVRLLGLEPPTDEVQVYPFRMWPDINVGTESEYRSWLKLPYLQPPTSRSFPSIYQLAHAFINNILMPKAEVKTNIEMNSAYLLRHLIAQDLKVNIPYIIVNHMKHAMPGNSALPYGHILTRLVRALGLEYPKIKHGQAINLFDRLDQLGWTKSPHLNNRWIPNNNQNNQWIKNHERNQFIHPDQPAEPEPVQPEFQPQFQTQFQPFTYDPNNFASGSGSGSGGFQYQGPWAVPPPGEPENPYLGYIVKQLGNLSMSQMHLMSNQAASMANQAAFQARTDKTLHDLRTELSDVRTAQRNLELNWLNRYGEWCMPGTNTNPDETMPQAAGDNEDTQFAGETGEYADETGATGGFDELRGFQ